ncbi:MAG: ATP-dependent zinc protease [Ectothiorhodospiraceae bacterium]|nr:ATP-dependent zinc protease [Ectothiorhodospiraceae bacterium]MCH8505843.1 RimK/LysX family protein [Ectothiorhodospiraceae bacterium]
MRLISRSLLLSISLALLLAGTAVAEQRELAIYGWLEEASLGSGELTIRAKLDTGADNSSLNAPDFEIFEKDDDDWVRFTVTNQDEQEYTFEKKIVRQARIRSASGTSRRPVVKMEVCVGEVLRHVEVNLADRSELGFQMLIGRSYMKDRILVDSGEEFTASPDCAKSEADDADRPDESGDYDDGEEQTEDASGNDDEGEDDE